MTEPSTQPSTDASRPSGGGVRLAGVTKRYGDLVVLDGLDLSVEPGERVALIGPSGSGKSTILRLVMTLERPDGGVLEIDGEPYWALPGEGDRPGEETDRAHRDRLRRKVGMVFQHFHLFPHMSVLRNVTEAPVHVLGLPKAEARSRAEALLDRVGLADKLDARPAQLSGGQKQRVAIARALALEPRILLFDEVTSALDPELVGEVLDVLRELAETESATLLLVTHQMGFAREFADRIAFLDGGRVVEEGPAEELLRSPREPRTREFLERILEV